MEHSTKLDKLPDGITFPKHLHERIRHIPERRRLTFHGFMTKCSYDELIALSNDLDYRRALEQIFVLSSQEIGPRTSRRLPSLILILSIAGSLVLAIVIGWHTLHRSSRGGDQPANVQLTNSARGK